MDDEQKRRELVTMHKDKTNELMGVCTRLTAHKATVAHLELKRDLVTSDIDTINAKLRELE